MELALVCSGIQLVVLKSGEYFSDMGQVLFRVIRIYQDIIQVHNYRDINHIGEDVIHEPLEAGQGIHEPLGHH